MHIEYLTSEQLSQELAKAKELEGARKSYLLSKQGQRNWVHYILPETVAEATAEKRK